MEQIIANIGWFLELLMIEICIHIVWDKKLKFGVTTIILFVYNGVALMLVANGIIPEYCRYIIYLLIFINCFYEFRKPVVETIVKFLIAMTFAIITEILAVFIVMPFMQIFSSESRVLVMINMISVILVYMLGWIFRKQKSLIIMKFKDIKVYRVVLIGVIPLIVIIIDYSIYHTIRTIYDLSIISLVLLIYRYLSKIQTAESELEKKNLELELQRIYSDAYKELITEVRQRQHDFKNQLSAVHSMHLVANSLEELVQMQSEYCEKLAENIRYDQILTGCNDSVLAGYLYYKCLACEKLGVQIDYRVRINDTKCQLGLHELIEILGILVDNACEQVITNNYEDKRIELNVQENEEDIILKVSNPSQFLTSMEIEKMFESGYSTKGENRGLGLARIKQLVNKYNLDLIVSNVPKAEENWFLFQLIISKKV